MVAVKNQAPALDRNRRLKAKNDHRKLFFILAYTVAFLIATVLVYHFYWESGKSFLWVTDGKRQHFTALMYYGVWLRSLFTNLIHNHTLSIPTYSFSLGSGGDIVNTLHYYAVGDPLNLLSVAVPSRYTELLYSFLILLRLYLAGLAFSALCWYLRKDYARAAVITGAMIYVFSGYSIYTATRHPYFINPMIYFPLMILGIERLLRERRWGIYVLAVSLSAVSNFYFFYMIVILTILYVLIRLLFLNGIKQIKTSLIFVLQLFGWSVLGTAIAGVILLPSLMQFTGDPRMASTPEYDLLYPLRYYQNFLQNFFVIDRSNEDLWLFMGYGPISLMSLFILFTKRKKRTFLKVLLITMLAMLLIPTVGHILNGLSYPANRFCWALTLIVAYIVTDTFEEIIGMGMPRLLICLGVCMSFGVAGLYYSASTELDTNTHRQILLLGAVVLVLILAGRVKKLRTQNLIKAGALLTAVLLCISMNASIYNAKVSKNYVAQFADSENLYQSVVQNEAQIVGDVTKKHDMVARYSGSFLTKNAAILNGAMGTQYYYSLSNPNVFELFNDANLTNTMPHMYDGFDDCFILTTLDSVKYYVGVTQSDDDLYREKNRPYDFTPFVPYGYDAEHPLHYVCLKGQDKPVLVEDTEEDQKAKDDAQEEEEQEKKKDKNILKEFYIYKTKHNLPLGYTYDSYVPMDVYQNLTPAQKQEVMLQGAVLEEDVDLPQTELSLNSTSIPYQITTEDEDMNISDNAITATGDGTVTLTFEAPKNAETYLLIEGLSYEGYSKYTMYQDGEDDRRVDPQNLFTAEEFADLLQGEQNSILLSDRYYLQPSKVLINVECENTEGDTITKELTHLMPQHKQFSGKQDYMMNLGYDKHKRTSLTITFDKRGIYSFDSLQIISNPVDDFIPRVNALKAEPLENIDLHRDPSSGATNLVTGDITLSKDKLLCLSIPYQDGWIAYVDGEKLDLLRVNTMYCGLRLNAGYHQIELRYSNRYFVWGMILSIVSIAVFVLLLILSISRRKKNKQRLPEPLREPKNTIS